MNTDDTSPAKDDQQPATDGMPSAEGDTTPKDKPTSSTSEVRSSWLRPDMGLPICTSLAAIVFALSSTLGSGSYLEPFSGNWKYFVKVTLFTTTVLFIAVFSVSIYSLVWSLFSSGSPPKFSFKALDDAPRKARRIVLFFFAMLIFAGFSTVISDRYDPDRAFVVMIVLGILIGAAMIVMLFSYAAIDVLKTDVIGFVTTIVIFVGSSIVWYNQFRDAEKSALVSDSQYCYWLRSAFDDMPEENDEIRSRPPYSTFLEDQTCIAASENGRKLDAYRVTP